MNAAPTPGQLNDWKIGVKRGDSEMIKLLAAYEAQLAQSAPLAAEPEQSLPKEVPTQPVPKAKRPTPDYAAMQAYADCGYNLIPGRQFDATLTNDDGTIRAVGKAPADAGWSKLAYDNARVLRDCENDSRNILIRPHSRQFIVDVDTHKGGDDSFARLCKDSGFDFATCPKLNTPSGGMHFYMTKSATDEVPKTSKEYPGIDFLSFGHAAMIAGDVHPNLKHYAWDRSHPPLDLAPMAPAALIAVLKRKVPKSEPEPDAAVIGDKQLAAILAALPVTDFKTGDAWRNVIHTVKHGTGGAAWALAQIKTWTVDPNWPNGKTDAEDVWTRSDAEREDGAKVGTLFKLLKDAGHADLIPREDNDARELVLMGDCNEADLPPRDFIFENIMERGSSSVMAGQPGAGKSVLATGAAMSGASGKPFGPFRPKKPVRVAMCNAEDSVTEQRRRMFAMLKTPEMEAIKIKRDLLNSFPLHTLQCNVMTLASMNPDTHKIEPTRIYKWLVAELKRLEIDLLFVDPLVELTEGVNENDNSHMHSVMALLRTIARDLNIHVCIVHHFNKPGEANNPGSVRGGSSILGAARMVLNLEKINDKDCSTFGVSERDRHSIIKLVMAKANYTPTGGLHWFKLVPQKLANGDVVASIETHAMKRVTLTTAQVLEFLDKIEAKRPDNHKAFTAKFDGRGKARADKLLMAVGLSADHARQTISRFLTIGILKEEDCEDASRNHYLGLTVGRRPDPAVDWDADPFQEKGGDQ